MKFFLPESAIDQHIAILGKTGSSKTWTAKLLVDHVVKLKRQVCVLDYLPGHGVREKERRRMKGQYKSRRQQILAEARQLKDSPKELALAAAFIGACAERDRTLEILRVHGLKNTADAICAKSIHDVLNEGSDDE